MKKKRILICGHHGKSGGNLVLSQLCSLLREKGYDARIFPTRSYTQQGRSMLVWWKEWIWYILNVGWYRLLKIVISNPTTKYMKGDKDFFYNPVDGTKIQIWPFFNKEKTIVVYNEGFWGNFLKAKHVVRWLLSDGYEENRKVFDPNDLVLAFRQIFNDYRVNPTCKVVTISCFNHQLYRQYNNNERKGNCYIVKKGNKRLDLPKQFDGPIVDGKSEKEIVEIFNNCKYCYSYDVQTMYSIIAAVCGCISIVVPEDGKKRSDYLKPDDGCGYGIAYGDSLDEIQYAIETRDQLLKSIDFTDSNEQNINKFIKYIEIFDKPKNHN